MWSSPRNLSTAMMYSWRQRADTTVVDEPIYAHYLRVTGRHHPGDRDVLAAQDPDGEAVVQNVLLGEYDTPVVFFKQMAKHLVDLDRSFLPGCRNILLTREPHDMLTSLQVQLPDATLDDTGFPELVEILDTLLAAGEEPIVVDTKLLLIDPRSVLVELCARLGLEFDDAMLSWPAGPKPEDGAWAPHWYEGVHRSTGWQPYGTKDVVLIESLLPVLEQAQPLYARLMPYRIGLPAGRVDRR
ncbi:MAG: sulfotransferase family protein [Acidimicrobiia bacterium]|nr:sulfotransferase family protein [Acidimicrobiia bacterium]